MKSKTAYAQFAVKTVNNEDSRIITGVASSVAPDRSSDVVEPLGALFSLPLPFLFQHDASQPCGHVIAAAPNGKNIPVTVQMVKVDEPGALKDRLDEAWQSIKSGLVRGLSIGFTPVDYEFLEGGKGIRFLKWNWLELSAVTIPANADASITSIKAADIRGGESDRAAVVKRYHAGASFGHLKSIAQKNGVPDNVLKMIGMLEFSFLHARQADQARIAELEERLSAVESIAEGAKAVKRVERIRSPEGRVQRVVTFRNGAVATQAEDD